MWETKNEETSAICLLNSDYENGEKNHRKKYVTSNENKQTNKSRNKSSSSLPKSQSSINVPIQCVENYFVPTTTQSI